MIVTSMNRMARGMDYPKLVDPSAILNTVGIVEAPGTDYSNQFNDGAGLGDFSVIGDYFTSTNYYIGFIAIGLIAFSLFNYFSSPTIIFLIIWPNNKNLCILWATLYPITI